MAETDETDFTPDSPAANDDYGDGFCIDCGDPFHYDDCGGYNPPCSCGFHCWRCHEIEVQRDSDDDTEDYDDDPR